MFIWGCLQQCYIHIGTGLHDGIIINRSLWVTRGQFSRSESLLVDFGRRTFYWVSLVTLSTVASTSLSLDPQFPFALLYCFCLCNSDPLLCTRYKLVPFLSYKYLYSVPR